MAQTNCKQETKLIEIENLDLSGGKFNPKTGTVRWKLSLKPNESKELILDYSVTYPNYLKVYVE